MDTVKVDVQKLQLLNDRIAQMIEALNQVRMSANGIPQTQYGQFAPFGYQSPYGQQGYLPQPYPVHQVPMQYAPQLAGFGGQYAPQLAGFGAQYAPQLAGFGSPYASQLAGFGAPFASPFVPGIQHTPYSAVSTPWATAASPWGHGGNGISHTTTTPWTWSY